MAHKVINSKVVVDWTTGDPEGDRITLLSAYRDFIKEVQEVIKKDDSFLQNLDVVQEIFNRWSINTENQIDEVPRIWIKRPQ